jgi:hypothetical protein
VCAEKTPWSPPKFCHFYAQQQGLPIVCHIIIMEPPHFFFFSPPLDARARAPQRDGPYININQNEQKTDMCV